MSDLIPGKRYRVTVEGIARGESFLHLGSGAALYSSALDLATIEELPDPLPTTPGSVVRDRDGEAWQLDGNMIDPRWCSARYDRTRFPHALAESYGPFTVLFDAGAEQ